MRTDKCIMDIIRTWLVMVVELILPVVTSSGEEAQTLPRLIIAIAMLVLSVLLAVLLVLVL